MGLEASNEGPSFGDHNVRTYILQALSVDRALAQPHPSEHTHLISLHLVKISKPSQLKLDLATGTSPLLCRRHLTPKSITTSTTHISSNSHDPISQESNTFPGNDKAQS